MQFSLFEQVLLFNEQKLCLRIDEALDQPGAGDPIDFDVFTCDPFHIPPHGRQEYVNLMVERFS